MGAQQTVDGVRGEVVVRVRPHPEPRYTAVIAHGYGEHGGRYGHVVDALAAHGATVVVPDHHGHGLSAGERALVQDADDFVTDLHSVIEQFAAPGVPIVLIGHSMGGLIATRYAQLHPGTLGALVLSGPMSGGNPALEALATMDPLPEIPIDPAVLSRDPAVGEAYMADDLVWHGPFKKPTLQAMIAATAAIAEGPTFGSVPTLWLHGELDQLAPVEPARVAVERLAGDRLVTKIYPGAQHEVFNETNKADVLADLTAFIEVALR